MYKYVIDTMGSDTDAAAMLLCYGCYASGLRYKIRAEYALYVMSDRGKSRREYAKCEMRVLHIIRCRLVVRGVGTRRRGEEGEWYLERGIGTLWHR